MIKLTYEHICDGCKKTLDTEVYECSDYPGMEFPRPHRQFSFNWFGINAQLCKECAAPLYEAQRKTMEIIIANRGNNET